ncbi:hypothetical protein OPV22_022292 [Ensete ventricosum]|uniref:Uncharacterized protein n=1 Tax=Ensete ventricosum TaxID=4639 RepID=A0AAV8PBX3_ENSVE|nr:hypothetical protein OPV22_022292 [Ensete ventricosum]
MDDFSFPTITVGQDSLRQLPFPHFAASPLWFLPSVVDRRKSSSSAGEASPDADMTRGGDLEADGAGGRLDEEKMDMLWEDFNEELARVSCDRKRMAKEGSSSATEQHCAEALKDAKSGGGLIHRRTPSLILMVKVLKKLFLIQRAVSSKKQSLCSA